MWFLGNFHVKFVSLNRNAMWNWSTRQEYTKIEKHLKMKNGVFSHQKCALFQYARHNGGSCMRTFRWWNSWNAVQCVILVYVFIFWAFYEQSHLLWYNMLNRHIKCLFITTNTKLCCTNKRTPHKYHMWSRNTAVSSSKNDRLSLAFRMNTA